MRLAPLLVLALSVWQVPSSSFESDIFPGEGRPRLRATVPLQLRQEPQLSLAINSTLAVPTDRDLVFDQTVYRTLVPAAVTVLQATSISGRKLGHIARLSREAYYKGASAWGHVNVDANNRVEYLQYRAEGTCFVRVDGEVIDAEMCPTFDKEMFKVSAEPTVELWVRIVLDGKPAGWTLVDDVQVKVVGRTF
ncbi:MAG: hypothetical protein IT179_09495 [Acidobacteria bacterium]|nr:hypothetical protein [Acidobacteriota bacterium]